MKAAQSGDTVLVQAGIYLNDFAVTDQNITLKSVGGLAIMKATVSPPNGRAILTTTAANVTVDGFGFSGAAVGDRNGAGIRQEGGNLVVRNSMFWDNQEGIVATSDPAATLLIQDSEFSHNGSGDGLTNNVNANAIKSLVIDGSYLHDAVRGDEIRSRAAKTTITNSRIMDNGGNASNAIDLPDGGTAVIVNNVVEKGANASGGTAINFGGSSAAASLVLRGNTVVSDKAQGVLLNNAGNGTVTMNGNVVWGFAAGNLVQGNADAVTQSGTVILPGRPALDLSGVLGNGMALKNFDTAYYLSHNPDVAAAGVDPQLHYLMIGWKEGRDPSASFSTRYYLSKNPDVAASGVNPLMHYEQYGWMEGRNPSLSFDLTIYRIAHPEVVAARIDPLQAYMKSGDTRTYADPLVDATYYNKVKPSVAANVADAITDYHDIGWKQGLSPSAWFDASYYSYVNLDVTAAGIDPLQHYEAYGWAEGRTANAWFSVSAYTAAHPEVVGTGINPLFYYLESAEASATPSGSRYLTAEATAFDASYYLAHNADVAAAHVDPLFHYMYWGWHEGRDPSAAFSTSKYLNTYVDVKAANVDPLAHYTNFGVREGRQEFSTGEDTAAASTLAPTMAAAEAPAPTYGTDGTEGLVAVGAPVYKAGSHVITVGVGKDFARIDDAIAASQDGDVLLVDAGTYTDQTAKVYHKIDIIGVGGRVVMNTTFDVPNQKGILVAETDLRVVNIDFVGAHISDALGHNAAGIRVDSGNIVIENSRFIDNQNGILTNPGADITVSIDHSVFDHNGGNDENNVGNTHNIYVGDIKSFRMTNSVSKEAQIGHELKSRAEINVITNNRIESGMDRGTGSYAIDLPNGGKDTVANNTIVKGPGAENRTIIHFGGEGIPYPKSSLLVQGNLILNNQDGATGILNHTSISVSVTGNKIVGLSSDALLRGPASLSSNVDGSGAAINDAVMTGILPGSTTIYTEDDKSAHGVVLNGGQVQAVQGGGGLLTVDVIAGHIIVLGGSGGMVINESATSGTGGNQYTTVAGSVNRLNLTGGGVIDSEGYDAITVGNGNSNGQLNGVSRVIHAGSGTINWGVNGTSTIQLGSGSTFIGLGNAADLTLTGTNDFFKVDGGGGNLRIDTINSGKHVNGSVIGGAWSMQTYDGMIHMTTGSGSEGVVMRMGDGDVQFISKGNDEFHAGTGATTVQIAGNAKVYAGTGRLDFYGFGSSGADLYGNGGTYNLGGDTGNITYHGGDRASTLNNNLGRGTILGGAGRLTVNGSAQDNVVGGSGGIVLNQNGGGGDNITTASGSTNVLNLSGGNNVQSNGNDLISWGAANGTMKLTGSSIVQVLGGNSHFTISGSTAMTVAGGNDVMTLLAGSISTLSLRGYHGIQGSDASMLLNFTNDQNASSSMGWNGGTVDAWTDNNGGIHATTSGVTRSSIVASGGLDLQVNNAANVTLGTGTSRVSVFGSNSNVAAGSGNATISGGWLGGSFQVTGGTGTVAADSGTMDMTFIGGSGAATLSGSSLAVTAGSGSVTSTGNGVKSFIGGSGRADIGLAGGAKVTLGSGSSHFTEQQWSAASMFTLTPQSVGNAIIDNFRVGTDKIALSGGVTLASQSVSGGSAHLLFSNGGNVTLVGVSNTQSLF